MDDRKVREFLWNQKAKLLTLEKVATGKARDSMTAQIQVLDTFFQFLGSQQTEEDMEKLKLSLDEQATPIDDIPMRARKSQMQESILDFIKTIPPGQKKAINGPGISKRTVTTTFYAMKEKGLLPDDVVVITRNNQKEVYLGRTKSEGNGKETEKEVINQKGK